MQMILLHWAGHSILFYGKFIFTDASCICFPKYTACNSRLTKVVVEAQRYSWDGNRPGLVTILGVDTILGIKTILRMVTVIGMVTVLAMVNILKMVIILEKVNAESFQPLGFLCFLYYLYPEYIFSH